MSVDLPAPFGPSRPNIPGGISSETLRNARTPFAYVFESSLIESIRSPGSRDATMASGRRHYCRDSRTQHAVDARVARVLSDFWGGGDAASTTPGRMQ